MADNDEHDDDAGGGQGDGDKGGQPVSIDRDALKAASGEVLPELLHDKGGDGDKGGKGDDAGDGDKGEPKPRTAAKVEDDFERRVRAEADRIVADRDRDAKIEQLAKVVEAPPAPLKRLTRAMWGDGQ